MGFDYALVHLKFTVTPAILLSLLYRPFFYQRDLYRLAFLIIIAVTATIPWDSYLIRNRVWSYPSDAVLGPTLFSIPVEELFFFVIQTYDVSLLYMLISKPTFYPACLGSPRIHLSKTQGLLARTSIFGLIGQVLFFLTTAFGAYLVQNGNKGTYMGLILVWAFPFLLFLWSLCHGFMLRIPAKNVILPIATSTLYLWVVDTLSLQRGTWVIEDRTKCGLQLWKGLELEEAIFFLVTNMLIVFGQVAFDNAVTVIDVHPHEFPGAKACPSPISALKALLWLEAAYDSDKIEAVSQAVERLQKKSRSFYLASSTFNGRLRIDLILLYSFCRLADDLVDSAQTKDEARLWISRLRKYLDLVYAENSFGNQNQVGNSFIHANFPEEARLSLACLPVSYLSRAPLYDLLKGFEVDLEFPGTTESIERASWPIHDESDLEQYGKYVAGTVAELCLDLVFHHCASQMSLETQVELRDSAIQMGIALQTVNISRDIEVDAEIGRVYVPSIWLQEKNMKPEMILKDPLAEPIKRIRSDLLNIAFSHYRKSRPAIERLPRSARAPMRVAIESYMEIGRVISSESYRVKTGRATVPIMRRILVAWSNLNK